MRILYLGTPDFACIPLEALVRQGYDVVGVVTQPDRPAGRRRTLTPPPVKGAAQRLGLPVLQPATLRDPAAIAPFADLRPDIGIVAAYGEILRKAVLGIPPLGYLNIHPSLLPRYRGPSPVAAAILAGDAQTGVTIMQLERRMDSGPVLDQVAVPMPANARTGPLTEALFRLGTERLLDVLPRYAAGTCALQPQDEQHATLTRLITKADGVIDWTQPAAAIERAIRAYDPWPGASTTWRGQPMKLLAAAVKAAWSGDAVAGTLVAVEPLPLVATGSGALALQQVQPAGKRPMSGQAWVSGQRHVAGERFGGA